MNMYRSQYHSSETFAFIQVKFGVVLLSEVIWPYFFEDEEGNMITVNGDNYRVMIRKCLVT